VAGNRALSSSPPQSIECLIGKRKHFRRISSRFDRYACRFLACVRFASAGIWPHQLINRT